MYNKFKQLGKDTVIYGLGGIAGKLINFILLPIYTRIFNPSDYGIMDVIATMVALAGVILTAGTETALSYYFFKSDDLSERRKTITTNSIYIFAINACIALVVFLLAEPISNLIFKGEMYAIYLRVAVLSLPFSNLVALNLNLLRLQRKPWAYLALSIPQLIFSILLSIYLVVILKIGIIGVFWAQFVTMFLFSTIGLYVNRSYFGMGFSLHRLAELLRYGLPLVISGLSMWSIYYLDRYFLLNFSTLEEIGLYSVGLRIASVINLLTQAFRTANAPFQFEIAADKNARQIYAQTLRYYLLLTSLACVLLSLFARPMLQLLTTTAYINAYKVVALATYCEVAYGAYQLIGVGLLLTRKTGMTGIAIGLGGLINVAYLYIFVPLLGMIGAALATLLAHLTIIVFLFVSAQKAYPIPYDLKRAFRTLACAAGVIVAGLWIGSHGLWIDIGIACGLLIFFLAMIPTLSLVKPNEWQAALHMLKEIALSIKPMVCREKQ